jgi:nucleolar protein TMA23
MWWMNAFDKSLQGLDTSAKGKVVQTVTTGGLDMVAKGGSKWVGSHGGLYATFVRGECLGGTITPEEETTEKTPKKKRRRDEDGEDSKEERRRARKAAKLVASAGFSAGKRDTEAEKPKLEQKKSSNISREELEEPARVIEGTLQVEEELQTKEERKATKAARRALKQNSIVEDLQEKIDIADTRKCETKEERKERKRQRKLLAIEQPFKGQVEDNKAKKRQKA